MSTITITLTDLPKGRGVTVSTNTTKPSIGRQVTPAEALAMDLLRTCNAQAEKVEYAATTEAAQ
ncbi:MAG: hypothetical protein V4718_00640 [Pseudomonadota bacterium]